MSFLALRRPASAAVSSFSYSACLISRAPASYSPRRLRLQAPPELLVLAEQVRTLLTAYEPGDPAVTALKASPAYQKVAYLIEGIDGGGLPS